MQNSGGLVLVPVDFTPQSEAAVLLASELVGNAFDRILVLHVVHETGGEAGYYRSRDDSGELRSIPEVAEDLLARFLEKMRLQYSALSSLGEARSRSVRGLPARTIQEVADQENAALIVMAGGRRSGLARFFRASVAEQVAHQSDCPVVLITGARTSDERFSFLKKLHAVPSPAKFV